MGHCVPKQNVSTAKNSARIAFHRDRHCSATVRATGQFQRLPHRRRHNVWLRPADAREELNSREKVIPAGRWVLSEIASPVHPSSELKIPRLRLRCPRGRQQCLNLDNSGWTEHSVQVALGETPQAQRQALPWPAVR